MLAVQTCSGECLRRKHSENRAHTSAFDGFAPSSRQCAPVKGGDILEHVFAVLCCSNIKCLRKARNSVKLLFDIRDFLPRFEAVELRSLVIGRNLTTVVLARRRQ